jgi:hypothetical protein
MGVSAAQCAVIRDISRCHRKVDITKAYGFSRSVGALLRVIDELDVFGSRAPAAVLLDHYNEMDSTSCWHWLKHNICDDWMMGHNVSVERAEINKVSFHIGVHPPNSSSIPYWLNQIRRPIQRVLYDEGSARAMVETWSFNVGVQSTPELSSSIELGAIWEKIHEKAFSSGEKVIIVIDDEVRKLEDLLLPLMMKYHVIFAQNAKDGLDKLAATKIDLAIIDLQIGSGFQWSAEETKDYKATGIRLCEEIGQKFPKTKVAILTGSRHDIASAYEMDSLSFILRKPVDPELFEREVIRVLA